MRQSLEDCVHTSRNISAGRKAEGRGTIIRSRTALIKGLTRRRKIPPM